jgi:hypothetical protein
MGCVLCPRTKLKHRKNLGERINGQPKPEYLCGAAKPGSQFVQLQMREVQVTETALVQGLSVLASVRQPAGDGRLPIAEDAFSRRSIQPFGQCREHHGDLLRGSFQMIQRSIASRAERGVASRTSERLDPRSRPMLAIANQRVDLSIGNAKVEARWVGTGEAFGGYPSGGLPVGFSLHARDATSAGTGPAPEERVEARRQAGQSSGLRGFSRRWSLLCILPDALDWAEPEWGSQRDQSSERREDEERLYVCTFVRGSGRKGHRVVSRS